MCVSHYTVCAAGIRSNAASPPHYVVVARVPENERHDVGPVIMADYVVGMRDSG